MNNTLLQQLQKFGLSEKEITLYLQSLQVGPSPASILGQRAGINRSTAQYICQSLTHKHLLSVIQKNNSYIYTPEPPEKLRTLLQAEKRAIQQKDQQLDQIIKDLEIVQSPYLNPSKVKYFQGSQGIIEMFDDVLAEQKPIYGATRILDEADEAVNIYIQERYLPERKKHKIPSWMIFNDNARSKKYRQNDAQVNRTSLLVPTDEFPFDICFHIYGNKTAFYSFKDKDLTGVILDNAPIQKTMLSLFRLSWNAARRLPVNKPYSDIHI